MGRKGTIVRMTATIVAEAFLCAGSAMPCWRLELPAGVPDQLVLQVVGAYALGGAALGLIYGRFFEGCLKGPHPQWTFATDCYLIVAGVLGALILVAPAFSSESRTTIFGVALLLATIPTVVRLVSVNSELRRNLSRAETSEQT